MGNIPTRMNSLGIHWRQEEAKDLHRLAWELYCRLGSIRLVSQMPLMPPAGTLRDWAAVSYRKRCDCGFHGYEKPTKMMLRVKAEVQTRTKQLIRSISAGLDQLIEQSLQEALKRTQRRMADLDVFELIHLRNLQEMENLALKAVEMGVAPQSLTEAVDTIVRTQDERRKLLRSKEQEKQGEADVVVGVGLYKDVAQTLVAVMRGHGIGEGATEDSGMETSESARAIPAAEGSEVRGMGEVSAAGVGTEIS